MIVDHEGLKIILEQFQCGAILIGKDGEVFLCNNKALGFLEMDPIDLMEKGIDAAPPWSGLSKAIRALGQDGKQRQFTEVIRNKVRFSITVIQDGLFVYDKPCVIAMISDITRQNEIEELRSDFFSEFLKRLRGPLTSVKTALSVLSSEQYGSMDEAAREVAQLGHEEVKRLHSILSDMGELFALDGQHAGADLVLENVEVNRILTRCLRRYMKNPRTASREIGVNLPEGKAALILVADYEKLGLVLAHLIDNALAYSPESSPVRISASEVEGAVEIRIEDQGWGISPEDMPRVFDRFYRSTRPEIAEMEGAGLGLFIAKGFTEIMGGNLTLESRSKNGTTAVLRLPKAVHGGWSE